MSFKLKLVGVLLLAGLINGWAQQPQLLLAQLPVVVSIDNRIIGSFATIGEGVKFCPPGGKVEVFGGVYNEVVLIDKNISLIGKGNPTITAQNLFVSSTVIFDGPQTQNASISGFVITGALIDGIYCKNNASPTIEHNKISGNGVNGISCDNSSPTIKGNLIENSPTGVLCDNKSEPTIELNVFAGEMKKMISSVGGSKPTIKKNGIAIGHEILKKNQGIIIMVFTARIPRRQ